MGRSTVNNSRRSSRRSRRRWLAVFAGVAAVTVLTPALPASAQQLRIWDIPLGTHAADFSTDEFIEYACGSDGGPPLRFISGFADYHLCIPEPDGLYEVHFRYDDEQEYWALANRFDFQYHLSGTKENGHAVIVSALFNGDGVVHGARIWSDPRVTNELRERVFDLRNYMLARFDPPEWECEDLPVDERYLPIAGRLINQRCTQTYRGTQFIEVTTHHFRKPGQFFRDPITNVITEGQFESTVRFELVRNTPVDAPGALARPDRAGEADPVALRLPEYLGQVPENVAAFLRGETLDCPGCDLTGAVLKRMDLAGANLAGAILVDANLHNASLGGANLEGADLTGANLNRVRAERANFSNAILTGAMGFAAHFDGADLSGARLEEVKFGNAILNLANLSGAVLLEADMFGVRAPMADFTGARLERVMFALSRLSGTTFRGADVYECSFAEANLIGADMNGASLVRTDFQFAQMNDANLAGVDFTGARLLSANVTGADMTDVVFNETVMMNGDIRTD
jgi:uncharacterized protein YjbI with pentapeptide repeats